MAGRTITPGTERMVISQSQIRQDATLLPTSVAKFTVIHKRPIITPSKTCANNAKNHLPNTMCAFSNHPAKSEASPSKPPGPAPTVPLQKIKLPLKKRVPVKLKRSLSCDDISSFQPPPAKRPFPAHIWSNRDKQPKLPVATCYWQDSPLHDSVRFVCIKLLEAAQAYRYLQLQGRARKYLHLTSGGIVAINNPPPRKPEIVLPPMTVKVRLQDVRDGKRPLVPTTPHLPPPPPLISLRPQVRLQPLHEVQDRPLELCKKPKICVEEKISPLIKVEPSQPVDLVKTVTPIIKKRVHLPLIPIVQLHEPLDLATPSPTTALKKMHLDDKHSLKTPQFNDDFRQRLSMVLQVLLGEKRLRNMGHPQLPIDEVLCKILLRAGIDPDRAGRVRENWMKFLRLCVKNEDAWKQEGWDSKSADAILNEIYEQDVVPVLKKTEKINGCHSVEEKV